MLLRELTHSVIGCCFDVHRELGPGFREYIYVRALERDLTRKGHRVQREVWVTVYFRGEPLARERIDMLVDGKLVVEAKAGVRLPPDVHSQTFSFLAATNFEVALILHFGRDAKAHRVVFENHLKFRHRVGR